MGFGVEAGNWKKDARQIQLFYWNQYGLDRQSTIQKQKHNHCPKPDAVKFLPEGAIQLTNHLYAIAAPGIVNLSYFELQTGLRYVIPVTR